MMRDPPHRAGLEPLSDEELLRRFRADKSEDAFHELVRRYLGLVFAVALRRSGHHDLAEEAAQNTFTVLARKASSLKSGIILGGWLHRVARFETSELLRREHRRIQLMKDYHQQRPQQPGVAHPWGEALDVLDDALAELRDSDRDALMLRFQSGLPFRQLAARLGISEEAGRKRVDRALEKLARLLGKRGIALPPASVAGCVSAAYPSAAPTALASSVAQKALVASMAAPASTAVSEFTSLLMTSAKLKTMVAGTVVLLGIASFLTGRHDAIAFSQAALKPAPAAPPAAPSQPALENRSPESGQNSLSRSARLILEEAAHAVRAAQDVTEAYYRALLVLRELSFEQIPEAVAFLETIAEERLLDTLGPIVAGIWAESDGPAAAEWAERRLAQRNRLGKSFERILSAWAQHDPEEAYAWYGRKAGADLEGIAVSTFRWLPKEIFTAWAGQNPWAAASALEAVALEDRDGAILGFCDALEQSPDPRGLLNAVHGMADVPVKTRLIEKMAQRWAQESPEAAATWVDSVPFPDAMSRLRARGSVAEQWLRQDRTALLRVGAWLLAGAPSEMRGQILEALANESRRMRPANEGKTDQ